MFVVHKKFICRTSANLPLLNGRTTRRTLDNPYVVVQCYMHERDVSMCLCSRKGQRLGRSECKQQSQGIIPKTVKTVHVARGDTDTSWLTYCIGYRTLLSSLGYFAAWGARYCDLRAVACGHPPVPHTRCYLSSDIIWQPRNGCMLTTLGY